MLDENNNNPLSLLDLTRLQAFASIAVSFYKKNGMHVMKGAAIELHDKLSELIRKEL